MNILLVEDQKRLAEALSAILKAEGHHVDTVGDGRSGLEYAVSAAETGTPYDAIVLDVMLPLLDGFEVARALRRAGSDVPVIMLTARDTVLDKVTGLDAGADDYLTKPFQPAELLARLRALTRRSGAVHIEAITLGTTSLDLQSADLRIVADGGGASAIAGAGAASTAVGVDADGGGVGTAGTGVAAPTIGAPTATPTSAATSVATAVATASVHLSQREFELCQLFMANPGQTLTKSRLLSRVWGLDSDADENSVEAYVSFLRKKLNYLGSSLQIVTVRGMGYRLEEGGSNAR
jgi:DNA-binding response OmpR family regulator